MTERRIRTCVWLWLLWPMLVVRAQNPMELVRAWLPVGVGDRWTYQAELLSGDQVHPQVER